MPVIVREAVLTFGPWDTFLLSKMIDIYHIKNKNIKILEILRHLKITKPTI